MGVYYLVVVRGAGKERNATAAEALLAQSFAVARVTRSSYLIFTRPEASVHASRSFVSRLFFSLLWFPHHVEAAALSRGRVRPLRMIRPLMPLTPVVASKRDFYQAYPTLRNLASRPAGGR